MRGRIRKIREIAGAVRGSAVHVSWLAGCYMQEVTHSLLPLKTSTEWQCSFFSLSLSSAVSSFSLSQPTFLQITSPEIRRAANFTKFRNVARRILKLQNFERVGRAPCLSLHSLRWDPKEKKGWIHSNGFLFFVCFSSSQPTTHCAAVAVLV